VRSIDFAIARPWADRLELSYIVAGDMSAIVMPAQAQGARRDGLWRHTCFEIFLREAESERYIEFNFSPSSEFAAYGFDAYRDGMTSIEVDDPAIRIQPAPAGAEARVSLDLARVREIDCRGPLLASATAIIEETDGTKSYWALSHPPGPPDFHHRDGFVLDLPVSFPASFAERT
jgi:hypothetical protein